MIKFFEKKQVRWLAIVVLTACVVSVSPALAAVMTSPSYSIQSDSVNTGGSLGNSASYRVEDTTGEIASGDSQSASYKLRAGYQQLHEVYISMTAPSDVVMSPALGGVTGGTSNGSSATTVITDSPTGYALYIKASTSPAMQADNVVDSMSDYVRDTSAPDFSFAVAGGAAEFGFSPEGTDVASEYLDNGATCSTGSTDTADSCWSGLTTSNELIATRATPNHPSGIQTTVKFRLTIGALANKIEDTYTATTTLTAIAI